MPQSTQVAYFQGHCQRVKDATCTVLVKVVSAAGLYVMNSLFRCKQRRIYMPKSAIPESYCPWIVLFAISVGMYLS